MTLTTRLLLFAQLSLAVLLAGFCTAFIALSHTYIHRQADENLAAAANTLVASVDIEADSVEWEPADRAVVLRPGPLGGAVCWFITDARGALVDRAPQPETADLLAAVGRDWRQPPAGGDWLAVRRIVHPPTLPEAQFTRPRTAEEVMKGEYPFLAFTVGIHLGPIQRTLTTLTAGLAGLAALVWLIALAVGYWVCRRCGR